MLEHLCIADELYEAPLAALLRSSRPGSAAAAREWKPSFIGGAIAGSLLKPRPLKSPKVFRPGPDSAKRDRRDAARAEPEVHRRDG